MALAPANFRFVWVPDVADGFTLAWTAEPDATGYIVGWDSVAHSMDNGALDDGDPFDQALYPHTQDVGNVTSALIAPGSGTWYVTIRSYTATEDGPWALDTEQVEVV